VETLGKIRRLASPPLPSGLFVQSEAEWDSLTMSTVMHRAVRYGFFSSLGNRKRKCLVLQTSIISNFVMVCTYLISVISHHFVKIQYFLYA
jgi:hypothetical protein